MPSKPKSLASENQFFVSTRASMKTHIQIGMKLTRNLSLKRTSERMQSVQDEHEAVYNAIQDKDPARAQKKMQTHINNARLRMFEG